MKNKVIVANIFAKKTFGVLLAASIAMTGCGNTGSSTSAGENDNSEGIELVEPVSVSESYVTASRRTMYDYTANSAFVVPEVTELSYSSGQSFDHYGKLPGDEISTGEVIIYGNTENVEEQIKELKKSIAEYNKSYDKELENLRKDLDSNEADLREKQDLLDKFYETNNFKTEDGSYYAYEHRYDNPELMKLLGWYASSEASLDHLKLRWKQTTELFALDSANRNTQLKHLNDSIDDSRLSANKDGVVVSVGYYNYSGWIGSGKKAAAIGDMNSIKLMCEYVSKSVINSADDVYAVVNGERYEVEYQPLDSTEYERLQEQNGVVYATFDLIDPAGKVKVGDYAVIMVINHRKENVLAIPTSAIITENGTSYVYVMKDGEKQYVSVKCGMKDGNYTEILSGIEEGDQILCEQGMLTGKNTEALAVGTINSTFTGNGYLMYPTEQLINNPVEYGTTYIDEICVSQYQQVEEGQVLARIHVVADNIEISKIERQISRAESRVADLIKDGELKHEDEIEAKREMISDLKETLSAMKKDRDRVEITAPFSGIITEVIKPEVGDILGSKGMVAYLADSSSSYILVDDPDNLLNYGNIANIKYDSNGKSKTSQGEVVTVNVIALGKDLKDVRGDIMSGLTWGQSSTGSALVRIAEEDVADMAGSSQDSSGWWNRSRFSVTVETRKMDNVVLVPKKAVKEISGTRYVKIKKEDGTIDYVSFVSGGADNNYYWVAEGLSEGMTICYD